MKSVKTAADGADSLQTPATQNCLRLSPLIHHDWLIARNSVADVFKSWRDRVLLVLALMIGAAWLLQAVRRPAAPLEPSVAVILVAAAAFTGFAIHGGSVRRLRSFVKHSPLGAEAVQGPGRWAYHGHWQALLAITVLATAATIHGRVGKSGVVLGAAGLAAQALGILVSMLVLKVKEAVLSSGRLRMVIELSPREGTVAPSDSTSWPFIITRRQVRISRSRSTATALVAATFAGVIVVSIVCIVSFGDEPRAVASVGIITAGGILLLARIDEEIVRFSTFAGVGAWANAATHWLVPLAFASGSMVATVVIGVWTGADPVPRMLAVSAGAFVVVFVVTIRVWQCRLMPLASADRVLLIDTVACLVLGLLFWPLAIAWVGIRVALLYRRTRAATWLVP